MKIFKLSIIISLLPLCASASLSSGLVAFYTFDGNGDNIAGANLDLAAHGATYEAGLFGQAASLKGAGQYLASSDNMPITGNSSRSFSVWLKPRSVINAANVVGWGTFASAGDYWGLYMLDPHAGQAWITTHWNLFSSGPAPFSYSLNAWMNFAVTYDGIGHTADFYLNGNYVGGYVSLGSGMSVDTASGLLSVGYFNPNSVPGSDYWSSSWDGLIDDLRIYDRVLTPGEVMTLATVPEPGAFSIMIIGAIAVAIRRRATESDRNF